MNHPAIAALGMVTICCYGAWYYSFGVLLDPLLADTGWRESWISGSFAAGLALIGIGSVFGGRLLDRLGPRAVFALAALVSTLGLGGASFSRHPLLFAAGSALGMGALGALGFYHVTMTTVVRLHPDNPQRAIAALTIWGALSSPIYLPLAVWMNDRFEWRTTIRLLLATAVLALVAAIIVVPNETAAIGAGRPSLRSVAAAATAPGETRAFTIAVALIGVATSVLLSYQVPVMVAAGLPLAAASTAAGARGFCQLGGRLPLGIIVGRIGTRRAMFAALGAIIVGSILLVFSSNLVVALAFAVVVGIGIGAYSPLQGMRAAELYDRSSLGATMGFQSAISQLVGATGPLAAGLVAESTGDRRWVVPIATTSAIAAVLVLQYADRGFGGASTAER
ncbi:MAG: MFS transporter [Actinomycetota bacterium]|nr:MFS transporter [Actinomycetota bacterium]